MANLHYGGDIIGDRYQIITLLGEGGMGKTYSAIDLETSKKVAIKTVFLSEIKDWKTLDLFEREAKVLATLNHPYIPNYLAYFYLDTETDRRFYLIQELITGASLYDLVKNGYHFTEEEIKKIAIQVLEILNYIHQLSPPVIHRDLKPQNLIKNEKNDIYLVDFGAVQNLYYNTLSLHGTIVGTFGYMPPEQFRGKAFFASDLYSLGATLIFLLTHRSPAELPHERLKIDFRNRVKVSEEFAEWLDKMTAPAFEERYKSAEEALQILSKKRKNSEIKIQDHRLPKGSKIKINCEKNKLKIKLPPAGLNKETINTFLLTSIWNGIVLMITIPAFFYMFTEHIVYVPLMLLLVLNGVGIGLIILFLWRIFGVVEIKLNHNLFIIKRILFKQKYEITGNIKDIYNVRVIEDINAQGRKGFYCTMLIKGSNYHWYKFGNGLTPVEQDFIVKEINDFIRENRKET